MEQRRGTPRGRREAVKQMVEADVKDTDKQAGVREEGFVGHARSR